MSSSFVVLCGSARTSPHNQWCVFSAMAPTRSYFSIINLATKPHSFIEGPKIALVSSKDFENGHYKTTPQHGIRAFARVYSAWAYGQTVSSKNALSGHSSSILTSDPRFFASTTVVPKQAVSLRRDVGDVALPLHAS